MKRNIQRGADEPPYYTYKINDVANVGLDLNICAVSFHNSVSSQATRGISFFFLGFAVTTLSSQFSYIECVKLRLFLFFVLDIG